MFTIQNDTIHDIDERCNIPIRKRVNRNLSHNHQDLYGDKSHYNERFNDLGVPGFIVITRENDNIDDYHHTDVQSQGVISDELFDELFNKVEKKSKKKVKNNQDKKTKNNRAKGEKDTKTKDKSKKNRKK